jgi:hypothetical protein
MPVYPSTPVPSEGIEWSQEYLSAIAGPYPNGSTVGLALRSYPLMRYKFGYKYISTAEMQTVAAFFRSMRGQAGTFVFKDWWTLEWSGVYVATGSGGILIFDLPSISTTSLVLRKDGTALANPADYTLGLGTGANGCDRVTLAANANGHILEADFAGQVVLPSARLTVDALPFTEGEAGNWSCAAVEILETV